MEELYQRIKASAYDELAVHKELCVGIKSCREAIHQWLNDNGLKFKDSSVSTSISILRPLQVKVRAIKQDQADNIPDVKIVKPTISSCICDALTTADAHSYDSERICTSATLLHAYNAENPIVQANNNSGDNPTFYNVMISFANCVQLSVQVCYKSTMYSTTHINHLCQGVARSSIRPLLICLWYDVRPLGSFYTMTQSQVFDPGMIITLPQGHGMLIIYLTSESIGCFEVGV